MRVPSLEKIPMVDVLDAGGWRRRSKGVAKWARLGWCLATAIDMSSITACEFVVVEVLQLQRMDDDHRLASNPKAPCTISVVFSDEKRPVELLAPGLGQVHDLQAKRQDRAGQRDRQRRPVGLDQPESRVDGLVRHPYSKQIRLHVLGALHARRLVDSHGLVDRLDHRQLLLVVVPEIAAG